MPGLPLRDLFHVVIGGNVASEDWSAGCWFDAGTTGIGTPTPTDLNTMAASMATAAGVAWSAFLKAWNASGLTLTFCKAYFYRTNTLYGVGQASISASAATGTAPQPGYVSQVLTFLTSQPGRSGRGRMYLPKTGKAPSASTFQYATEGTALSAMKTYFQSCESAIEALPGASIVASLSVVSRTGSNPNAVTTLRMDSIPDTQHGRTKSLAPALLETLSY